MYFDNDEYMQFVDCLERETAKWASRKRKLNKGDRATAQKKARTNKNTMEMSLHGYPLRRNGKPYKGDNFTHKEWEEVCKHPHTFGHHRPEDSRERRNDLDMRTSKVKELISYIKELKMETKSMYEYIEKDIDEFTKDEIMYWISYDDVELQNAETELDRFDHYGVIRKFFL